MLKNINKKMIIVIVLVVIAIIGAVVAIVSNKTTELTDDSYANCAIGDVNGDGYINSTDALLIQKFLNKQVELFESQQKNADVNLDTKVDAEDIKIISKYSNGTVRKLPYTGEGAEVKYKPVAHSTEDANSTVQIVHTWVDGDGVYNYQLNVSIENLKESRLRNWSTTIALNTEAEKSKSWDCDCEVKGNVITITGDSISAEESESVLTCGVIITASQGLTVESIVTEN